MTAFPEQFERDTGCTESDWLRWLPGACGPHLLSLPDRGGAQVRIGERGQLRLNWRVMPARRIALVSLPRMLVHYQFSGLNAAERADFMRYFDLYMQRGGG